MPSEWSSSMKLTFLLSVLLFFASYAHASEGLIATTTLSLNGEIVSKPVITFQEGYPVDMYLENPNGRIRISLFSMGEGGKQQLRVQLFEADLVGSWTLIGEPRISVPLNDTFSVEAKSKTGAGYRFEGVIERAQQGAVLTGCEKEQSTAFQCSTETQNWLSALDADGGDSIQNNCCTRNCRHGWTITCCGGCCSDPVNCPVGCCPQ